MGLFLRLHAWLYLHTGGWIGHRLILVPTLMLFTTGRKTRRTRASALVYARDAGSYVVVASKDGADRSPGWYFNLLDDPDVEIQIARRRMPATARAVEKGDPDYDRLWRLVNENNHGRYDGYQRKTSRPIPLAVLTPSASTVRK